MRLTHLGHACLLVEIADQRILVDPGTLARGWEELRDLDAVVVTHQHPDHLDPRRLPDLVRANPDAEVISDPGSIEPLAGLGVQARTHSGPTMLGDLTLTPVGEMHALIHEEIPQITNIGVRFDAAGEPSLFVPGDALDGEPGQVDLLAFPLNAPWQRSREMTAFLRRLDAPRAFPVHDGLLAPRGRALYLAQAGQLGGAHTHLEDLAGRGPVSFAA